MEIKIELDIEDAVKKIRKFVNSVEFQKAVKETVEKLNFHATVNYDYPIDKGKLKG